MNSGDKFTCLRNKSMRMFWALHSETFHGKWAFKRLESSMKLDWMIWALYAVLRNVDEFELKTEDEFRLKSLFVANIANDVDSFHFEKLFSPFGVEKFELKRGCGWLTFKSRKKAGEALRKLNKMHYHGKQLSVRWSNCKIWPSRCNKFLHVVYCTGN